MIVRISIVNWDERGDSVVKFGEQQAGYQSVKIDTLPSKTVLDFEFASKEQAIAGDEAISKFAKGLNFHLG